MRNVIFIIIFFIPALVYAQEPGAYIKFKVKHDSNYVKSNSSRFQMGVYYWKYTWNDILDSNGHYQPVYVEPDLNAQSDFGFCNFEEDKFQFTACTPYVEMKDVRFFLRITDKRTKKLMTIHVTLGDVSYFTETILGDIQFKEGRYELKPDDFEMTHHSHLELKLKESSWIR